MATTVYTTKLVDSTHRTLLKIVGTGGGDANTVLVDPGSLLYSLASNGAILGVNTNRKTSYRTSIKRIWGQGQMASNKYVTLQIGRAHV